MPFSGCIRAVDGSGKTRSRPLPVCISLFPFPTRPVQAALLSRPVPSRPQQWFTRVSRGFPRVNGHFFLPNCWIKKQPLVTGSVRWRISTQLCMMHIVSIVQPVRRGETQPLGVNTLLPLQVVSQATCEPQFQG